MYLENAWVCLIVAILTPNMSMDSDVYFNESWQ